MKQKVLFFFSVFISFLVYSQQINSTLNIEEFLAIVKKNHPIVKQGEINIEKSKTEITIARGQFNPVIAHYLGDKTIGGSNYYTYSNPSITIPTWFGVEFSAGVENFSGDRLDPSQTDGRLSYVGVQVSLLKNLIIDKRRADLRQAQLFKDLRIAEQKVIINNILLAAATQYWEWVTAYESYKIIEKNFEVSKTRFGLIKKTYLNGERPAMDTIEAKTQYQSFELMKNESWLDFQNQGLSLSGFLWNENNVPYQLNENILPYDGWKNNSMDSSINLNELVESAKKNHPELRLYEQKLSVLEVEKRLKLQELLPKLDVAYNHYGKEYEVLASRGLFFQNNYQYGLKFEMPLFLSKGRGEFKTTKLKIQETKIEQSEKLLNIELKIKNYLNEYEMLKKQVLLQDEIQSGYEKLLKGEETLFSNGESSLFLINSRENKFLENKRKSIELKIKLFKTIYALQWSAGLLL